VVDCHSKGLILALLCLYYAGGYMPVLVPVHEQDTACEEHDSFLDPTYLPCHVDRYLSQYSSRRPTRGPTASDDSRWSSCAGTRLDGGRHAIYPLSSQTFRVRSTAPKRQAWYVHLRWASWLYSASYHWHE
jgi:hypothetical protein